MNFKIAPEVSFKLIAKKRRRRQVDRTYMILLHPSYKFKLQVKSKYAWEPVKPGVCQTNQKGLHYEVFKQQGYSAVMAASLKNSPAGTQCSLCFLYCKV